MNKRSFVGIEEGKPFIARDGALIFELFRATVVTPRKISIASGYLKPKQKALPHFHKLSEEVYYVVYGAGKCRVGDVIEKIKAGDAVCIPAGAVHALENTSIFRRLKVLAISSPPYQDSDMDFVEQ